MDDDATPHWLGVLTLRPDLRDPAAWSDGDRAAVAAHFAELQRLAAEGAGRTDEIDPAGRMAEDTLGVVVFRAPDRAAAEARMAADAAVRAGVMRAVVNAFRVAVERAPVVTMRDRDGLLGDFR
jgi:uncharacterized protein YciI